MARRKWIFSGLGRRGEHMNKGVLAKTHFFLMIISYNDVLDHFKRNFLLEKSPKPLSGDISLRPVSPTRSAVGIGNLRGSSPRIPTADL